MTLDTIKSILTEQDMCVLATVSQEKPHCSLMAFVTEEECREIYMATLKNTNKYRSLKQNPSVSLLVDTREKNRGNLRSKTKAVTVYGEFREIDDQERERRICKLLLERHPHLNVLLDDPDVTIFCIKVNSFLLLEGLKEPHFISA